MTAPDIARNPDVSQAVPERIVWHAGFIKTGTTAVQNTLRENRSKLPERLTFVARGSMSYQLRQKAARYWENQSAENRAALVSATRALCEELGQRGTGVAIISDENITGYEPYSDRGTCLEAATLILPVIEEAASTCGVGEQSFVLYTREPEGWLRSCHNQMVKRQRCTQSYDDFRASGPSDWDWEAGLEALSARLQGRLRVYAMETEIAANVPMGSGVFQAAGLDQETIAELEQPRRRNESLSPEALHFMLTANRSSLDDATVATLRKFVIQHPEAFTSG
ncbi:MAG: hypothetical protein AAGA15_08245 [Pseudomonadota bacterium]